MRFQFFCFVSRNSQEMRYMKMQIAVSCVDSHDIQNVDLFSDLRVLPDVISEDTTTAVEYLQGVKSW